MLKSNMLIKEVYNIFHFPSYSAEFRIVRNIKIRKLLL